VRRGTLDELLRTSDIVSLHAPLSETNLLACATRVHSVDLLQARTGEERKERLPIGITALIFQGGERCSTPAAQSAAHPSRHANDLREIEDGVGTVELWSHLLYEHF
jgi:hypothetical protein